MLVYDISPIKHYNGKWEERRASFPPVSETIKTDRQACMCMHTRTFFFFFKILFFLIIFLGQESLPVVDNCNTLLCLFLMSEFFLRFFILFT